MSLQERLRAAAKTGVDCSPFGGQICYEAADELDRLGKKVKYLALQGITLSGECERLMAENAALSKAIDHAARVLRGDGVSDQGEAYDQAQRILDAAMEKQR